MQLLVQDKFGLLSSTYLLNRAFANGGFKDNKLNAWMTVFVRKVDVATEEYSVAQHLWSVHGSASDLSGAIFFTLILASDHLELCILSMRRALRSVDRLLAAGVVGSRLTRRRIDHVAKTIVRIRNSIEHIEKEISDGLDSREPHTLRISNDGLIASIADHTMKTSDIAMSIKVLRSIAAEIIEQTRSDGQKKPGK